MTIQTIANTDTFLLWQGKINQVIGVVDALTDGVLFVNGSLVFTNASFSLALQSLNVANNLVLTSPSGNSLFLLSSNIAANGTLYSTGPGFGLSVANSGFIGKNLTVVQVTTLNIANANSITSSALYDSGNRVITNLTINTANGLTGGASLTGNVATFNFGQTLTDNPFSNANNNAATANAVNTVYSAAFLKNVGGFVSVANSPWSSNNFGKQIILTCPSGNNHPTLGFTDITGVNLWAITDNVGQLQFSYMPSIGDTSDSAVTVLSLSNTGMTLRGALTDNISVTSTVTTSNSVVTNTLTTNTINVSNGIISSITAQNDTGAFPGQYVLVGNVGLSGNSNTAAILRNDGNFFYILTSGNVANPYTASWNSLRPLEINMVTGSVFIDISNAGTTFGGNVSMSTGSITTGGGYAINQNSIVMPNGKWLYGLDTGGTVAHPICGYDSGNFTATFLGQSGYRIYNAAGTQVFVAVDTAGDLSSQGTLNSIAGNITVQKNGNAFFGSDTGATLHPMLQYDGGNNINVYAGLNLFRVLSSGGSAALMTLDASGNMTLPGASYLAVAGSPAPLSGGISCFGRLNKAGYSGGFGGNLHNIYWDGSTTSIWIDNTEECAFPNGTGISDIRLKSNVADAPPNALAEICKLHEITYTFKNDPRRNLGYIAHEVAEIIPEAVIGEKDGVDDVGNPKYQYLHERAILARTTQALSELAEKHFALEKKYQLLEEKLAKFLGETP